jgi:hypothetical protein
MPPARGALNHPIPLVDALIRVLSDLQDQDGGWSYGSGRSWTEPTVFSLLALHAWQAGAVACQRAGAWLLRCERPDGGVAPNPSVVESTWVTALALLSRRATGVGPPEDALLRWLLRTQSEDSRWWRRLQEFVRGTASEETAPAWSWFPGTAGWVFPTACTLAAMKYSGQLLPTQGTTKRVAQGEKYMSLRVCRDGGWNHGSARALGYESDSYPETTGAALVGLRGLAGAEVTKRGIDRAQAHLATCTSSYAQSWLELGLLAHGVNPMPPRVAPDLRQPLDVALALIVLAGRKGVPVLWRSGGQ